MYRASLVAQRLKCLPGMQETLVWSLGREDPLEKEMATHSSTLAWRIPWMEELVGYSPWGRKDLDTTERLHFHFHTCINRILSIAITNMIRENRFFFFHKLFTFSASTLWLNYIYLIITHFCWVFPGCRLYFNYFLWIFLFHFPYHSVNKVILSIYFTEKKWMFR